MNKPKILFYDLEVTPTLSYTWGLYDQNVIDVAKEWELLSVAYKWYGEEKVYCITRQGESTDKNITKKLWKLLNEADVVVAHNGKQFDNKKSHAKFIEHGLTPPKPYQTIDTKIEAKRYFKFNSNRLNDLGKMLGIGTKVSTGGFGLWLGCMKNDPKSWKLMSKYNKRDVELLEKVYLKLMPWMNKHPNMTDSESPQCPKCSSYKLEKRGFDRTKANTYQRYRCGDCGGWCRSTSKVKNTKSRKITNL